MEPDRTPGTATRVIRRVGCRNGCILADASPILGSVQGVVRTSAWDLAVECIDEGIGDVDRDQGFAVGVDRHRAI